MAKTPVSTKDLLKEHFNGLRARRAELDAVNAPKQAELDALNAQIETLRAKAKSLAREIKGNGDSDLSALDAEIAQVALALGSARMSEGAAK